MENKQRDVRRLPVPIFATKKPRTALFAHPNNTKTENEVSSKAYVAKPRGSTSQSSWNSGAGNKWQQPAACNQSWQPTQQQTSWGSAPISINQQRPSPGQGYNPGPYGGHSNTQNQSSGQYRGQHGGGYHQNESQGQHGGGYHQNESQGQHGVGYHQNESQGQHGSGYHQNESQGQHGSGYQQKVSQGQHGSGYQQKVSRGQHDGGYQQNESQGNHGSGYQKQYQGPPHAAGRQQSSGYNATRTQHQTRGSSSWAAHQPTPTQFGAPHWNSSSKFTSPQNNYNIGSFQNRDNSDLNNPSLTRSYQSPASSQREGRAEGFKNISSPRYGQTAGRSESGYDPSGPSPMVQPWGMPDLPTSSVSAVGSTPFTTTQTQDSVPGGPTSPDEALTPPRTADKSLKVLSATVQGMQHWARYKDKTPLLFELVGRMDSALSTNRQLSCRDFLLKDDKENTVRCMFFEIDRKCPQLVRGQFYRCVGSAENGVLHCVSVRPAADPERRMHRVRVATSDRAMRHWVNTDRET